MRDLNPKFQTRSFHTLLLFSIVFWTCSNPTDIEDSIMIKNRQFNYLQDLNQLYFAMEVEAEYKNQSLFDTKIIWYAISKKNTPDTLNLYDDGSNGDIILGDGVYGLKIKNDSTIIKNTMGEDSGSVYLDFIAVYETEVITISDSFNIGNIIPRIIQTSAPSTIVRPVGETVSFSSIKVEVFDTDGLETIKWVGFTSYHVEGDSMMNKGNYIYLYDDGSQVILYEPNFTSGDSVKGDGIYTFKIPIYGDGFTDPNQQTKTGNFIWRFLTQDLENEYSKMKEHEILIQ